jgi:hypothetical protein
VDTQLLGLGVRIPPGAWMSVSCECCVLSGRGLCDGLILRPESPTECVVFECDRDPSIMTVPWPTKGCGAMEKITYKQVLCRVSKTK